MSMITESIDENGEYLEEAFEQLTSFIKTNKFTSKEVRRYNKILKNLTKQVWTKFYLHRKRYQQFAKNKGMAVVPMDKKFFDDFLKLLKADTNVSKAVSDSVGRDITRLDKLYKGIRSGKLSKEELAKRFEGVNLKPMATATRVVNAIALETMLTHMNEIEDEDGNGKKITFQHIKPSNRSKILSTMGKATKSFGGSLVDGFEKAASERSGRK